MKDRGIVKKAVPRASTREIFEAGYWAAHVLRFFVPRGTAKEREVFAHGLALGFIDYNFDIRDVRGAWAEYQVKVAFGDDGRLKE
jgi:hypothetical protein